MSPDISWMKHYGFYDPRHSLAVLPSADRDRFLKAAKTPVTGVKVAKEFLESMTSIVPLMQPLWALIQGGSIKVTVADNCPIPQFERVLGEKPILRFALGQQPMDQLNHLVANFGFALPIPEEISTPPSELVHRSQKSPSVAPDFLWRQAFTQSFFFQASLALQALEIGTHLCYWELGLLNSTKLALFRAFREGGLVGMAKFHSPYLSPDLQVDTGAGHLQSRLGILYVGPIATSAEWEVGEQAPPLPRTIIDDHLDSMAPFDQGYDQPYLSLPRLDSARVADLRNKLERIISKPKELAQLLDLIWSLAPALAARLLTNEVQRKVKLRFGKKLEEGQNAMLLGTKVGDLFGMNNLLEKQELVIEIRPGSCVRDILVDLVILLGKISMPAECTQRFVLPRMKLAKVSAKKLFVLLEQAHARFDYWGYSALFELYEEAKKQGVDFPLADSGQEEMTYFRHWGLFSLSERWGDFAHPGLVHSMRKLFGVLAREAFSNPPEFLR